MSEQLENEVAQLKSELAKAQACCAEVITELEAIGRANYPFSCEKNFRDLFYRCELLRQKLSSSTCGTALLEELGEYKRITREALSENKTLRAELDSWREDKARLDWLFVWIRAHWNQFPYKSRQAIDAARKS